MAPSFQPLPGVYEASAIRQLPDGRLLVVEDEQDHAFSLVEFDQAGAPLTRPLRPGFWQRFTDFGSLDDLEGLALDRAGFIYAITSHSRDDKGNPRAARERLVRFRVEGDAVVDPRVVGSLKRALVDRHPVLAAAARLRDVKRGGGLNIEALEVTPDGQLLLGFRSPLQDGRALVATVENAGPMFDHGEAPRVSSHLQSLDLGGNGIRALAYFASLGAYLLASGPVAQRGAFGLWSWSGEPGGAVRRVTVDGLPDFARAEGICSAVIDGAERILIVSDDGDRKSVRAARYLLLDPAQLRVTDE